MVDIWLTFAATTLAAALVWVFSAQKLALLSERLRVSESELSRLNLALSDATALRDKALAEAQHTALALSAERAAASERERALAEARARLDAEFKALSADALARNSASFLELAGTALGRFQQRAEGDLSARQQAIDALVKPLKDSLDKVDAKIADLERTRADAYGRLGQQLESLGTAQLRLQAEAQRLSTALRSTAYTGSWGEFQLRRVIEMADMLAYCDFTEQETSGSLRADVVIRLPGGQRVVVDAKTPIQAYRDALDATDETVRAGFLADHAARVRSHIDALGAKNYWDQFKPSPEFVVLFIPGDHFLSAALQTDPSLMERALARKVLLATPTTLIALLKAASYGWRQEAVSRNADEISALGRQLYDRIATFSEHLEKVGRGLDAAVKGYNAAIGSFEGSVLPGARKFAELGAKGAKDATSPALIDTHARDVTKRS